MFALKRERLLIGRVEATSKQFDYLNQSLALSNTYMFYLLYTLLVSSTVETFNMFIRKGTKCLPQNDPQWQLWQNTDDLLQSSYYANVKHFCIQNM